MFKNIIKQKNKASGFTLVETLVAISIFSVSVVALMSFLSQDISGISYAKKKVIANYLAQEGIEYIRNTRDSYVLYTSTTSLRWNDFKTKIASCTSSNECGFDISLPVTDSNSVFQCNSHTEQCKLYINNGNYNTNLSGTDSGFVRKVRADLITQDQMKITSTVSWTYNGQPYNITLTNYLFNWVE